MKQEYFVATIRLDDVELFYNRFGVWGSFSVLKTLITPTLEALDYHYHRLEKCHIKDDSAVKVQKLHMDVSFEEVEL